MEDDSELYGSSRPAGQGHSASHMSQYRRRMAPDALAEPLYEAGGRHAQAAPPRYGCHDGGGPHHPPPATQYGVHTSTYHSLARPRFSTQYSDMSTVSGGMVNGPPTRGERSDGMASLPTGMRMPDSDDLYSTGTLDGDADLYQTSHTLPRGHGSAAFGDGPGTIRSDRYPPPGQYGDRYGQVPARDQPGRDRCYDYPHHGSDVGCRGYGYQGERSPDRDTVHGRTTQLPMDQLQMVDRAPAADSPRQLSARDMKRIELESQEEDIKHHRRDLEAERRTLQDIRSGLDKRERSLGERDADIERRGSEMAQSKASFDARQEEYASREKEHRCLVEADGRLKKEIADKEHHSRTLSQEVNELEKRKADLLSEVASSKLVVRTLESRIEVLSDKLARQLQGQAAEPDTTAPAAGSRTTRQSGPEEDSRPSASSFTGQEPARTAESRQCLYAMSTGPPAPASPPAQAARAPRSLTQRPPASAAAPGHDALPADIQELYASGIVQALAPEERDAFIAEQLRGYQNLQAAKKSELFALQLDQELKEEAARQSAHAAEAVAREQMEESQRLTRQKQELERRDFEIAQALEEEDKREQRAREVARAVTSTQQQQATEQAAAPGSEASAAPELSVPRQAETIDEIRSLIARGQTE